MNLHPTARLFCFLIAAALLRAVPGWAQQAAPAVVSGTVLDARTQAAVPYADVAVPGRPGGTVTNAEGAFRLALPAGADSVRVQALGYAPLTLATGALGSATRPLRLQPQAYALQEATVTGFTPTGLLKLALRRTAASLASPVGLQAYYREFTVLNGRVDKFADALVDYYIVGNPRRPQRPEVQARVWESRTGEAALSHDEAMRAIPSPIGIDKTGSYYDVTEEAPGLDSTKFEYYRYALLEAPAGAAEAPYYTVRCTPTTHKAAYLNETLVYIDRQTFTIRHLESTVPPSQQPDLPGLSLFGIQVQARQYQQRTDFRELNGRLYPSFVRLQAQLDVSRAKTGELYRYTFSSEMLVRNLAAAPAPFARSEQYSGSIYKYGTHYTQPYWRQGNVVPATAAEEKAIEALSTDVAP